MSGPVSMWGYLSRLAACRAVILVALPAQARDTGPVTNLPLPRYVSLKAAEGNVRRGPSLTHRIDWVFQRRDMPLRITQVQCYSLEVVTPPEEWPNTEGDGR